MAQILNATYREQPHEATYTDSEGNEQTRVESRKVVESVTFQRPNGAVHTLTFHPHGTVVSSDSEPFERKVGEGAQPYHEFTDPQEAVRAYEDGEV